MTSEQGNAARGDRWELDLSRSARGEWVPPQRVADFIEWLATPPTERVHKSMRAYATANGWDYSTVLGWNKDSRVRELLSQRLSDWNVNPIRVQEVVDALHAKALTGDTNAIRTYLEFTGQFQQKRRTADDSDVEKMTDEEFRQRIASLVEAE